jgi:hypothetical protein
MTGVNFASIALMSGMVILGSGSSCPADAGFRLGATGGAGVGHMSYGSEFDRIKLGGGATLEYPVSQRLAIRSGLYWLPDGSGLDSPIPETTSAALRLNYIAVPIGVTYRPRPDRFPLHLYGALQWVYLINARWLEKDMNGGDSDLDVTADMRRWDVAPVLGIGVLTAGGFELALQHSWGLRSPWKVGDIENRSLWLLGTLWFDFP